jgi:hypothetical protein
MYPDTINIRTTGKIGARVYYYIDGQRTSRIYFVPIQPGTPAQLAVWQKFRAGVLAWQALTAEEKKNWNEKAYRIKIEGYNLFMSKYLRDLL